MSKTKDPTTRWPDDIKENDPRYGDAMAAMMSGGGNPAWTHRYGTRSPSNQDAQLEFSRLKTDTAYLKLRVVHLREWRRANQEWREAKIEQLAALQARATALLEVLELPNTLYRAVGGEGAVFDPVVRRYDQEGE